MSRSFETSDDHSNAILKPLRVPSLQDGIYSEAKNLVDDLPHWTIQSADDDAMTLVCVRKGGMLSGDSTVTIRVEGPEGMPSTTVHCRSESSSGLLGRDKANVVEFMRPFHRRVI